MDEHALTRFQGAGLAQTGVGSQEDGRHGGCLLQRELWGYCHQGLSVCNHRGAQASCRLPKHKVADPATEPRGYAEVTAWGSSTKRALRKHCKEGTCEL